MKIAVRVNDVEDKATTCIKEARAQLKKVVRMNYDFLISLISLLEKTSQST